MIVLGRRRPRQAVVGAEAAGQPLAAPPLPDLGHGEAVAAREHLLALVLLVAAARRGYCGAGAARGARATTARIAVPQVHGHQQVLVGEHVLVRAHRVAPPPVDAAGGVAGAGAGLGGVVVGILEPAEPDREHDAAARGLGGVWRRLVLLRLLLLDVLADGGWQRVRGGGGGGEMARGELGAAEGAGGAGAEPDVDAGDVEGVAAQREQAEPVVVRELAQADGAVERPSRLLLALPAGGGGAAASRQLAVRELRERVDGGLAQAAAAAASGATGAVVVRGEEEVLQLALPGAGAGVVALEEEAAQDVEQAGDEQHHGQDHRDEQHRRRDPRRRGGGGGGRVRPRRGRRRRGGVHRRRRRRRRILQQRARHCNASAEAAAQEVHIGAAAFNVARKKKAATGPPQSRRRHHLGPPAGAPLAAGLGPWLATSAAALIRCPA